MWKLNHKEGCALKNWIFWTVVLEKTLESPLDCKEIQLPILKKISPEYSLKGLMPEVPIVWPPDSKSLLLEKDPDAGEDWRQEKGTMEDEMVGWHHSLNGHEFEQTPGVGDGQGSLTCCSPWGHRELDRTEWLNKKFEIEISLFA